MLTGGTGIAAYVREILSHWPDSPDRLIEPLLLWGDLLRVRCGRRPDPQTGLEGAARSPRGPRSPHRRGSLRETHSPMGRADALTLRPLSALRPPRLGLARLPGRVRPWIEDPIARAAARRARRHDPPPAVYWEPNYLTLPLPWSAVTSVADLSVIDTPEFHPPGRVEAWRRGFDRALRHTAHWITCSHATARRLRQTFNIPADRVTIAHLAPRTAGATAEARPNAPPAARLMRSAPSPQITRRSAEATPKSERPPIEPRPINWPRALRPPIRYFIHLGAIEPRKNIALLLDAWALLPRPFRKSHRLLCVGPPGWGGPEHWRRLTQHPVAEEVLVAGRVSEPCLDQLLRHALAMLSPSRYEGFGLPNLEALQRGVPLIRSDIEAYDEVVADASIRLPVDGPARWAQAIEQVAEDRMLRRRLVGAGFERVKRFSWTDAARQHHDALARVAGVGAH